MDWFLYDRALRHERVNQSCKLQNGQKTLRKIPNFPGVEIL